MLDSLWNVSKHREIASREAFYHTLLKRQIDLVHRLEMVVITLRKRPSTCPSPFYTSTSIGMEPAPNPSTKVGARFARVFGSSGSVGRSVTGLGSRCWPFGGFARTAGTRGCSCAARGRSTTFIRLGDVVIHALPRLWRTAGTLVGWIETTMMLIVPASRNSSLLLLILALFKS